MMNKVFVLGSMNVDFVMTAPRVPKEGETIHGDGFMINEGGKGANQAVAAAKSGVPVYMIGCVGDDSISLTVLASLKKYRVNTQFVTRCAGVNTGAAQITVVNGDNRIILSAGANYRITRENIDAALEIGSAGDVFIVQNEIKEEMIGYGLERAHAKRLLTIFNPAPAKVFPEEILRNVRLLVANEIEAVQITQTSSLLQALESLRRRAATQAVVTLGEKGSLLIDGERDIRQIPAVHVQAVDTTAAGDTFIGVVGSCLAQGLPLESAMARATVASALTVTKSGAQCSIPTREDCERFAKEKNISVKAKTLGSEDFAWLASLG